MGKIPTVEFNPEQGKVAVVKQGKSSVNRGATGYQCLFAGFSSLHQVVDDIDTDRWW